MRRTADISRKLGKTEYFYWLYNKIECTNFVLATTLKSKTTAICLEPHIERTLKNFSRLQEVIHQEKSSYPVFIKNKIFRSTIAYRHGDHNTYNSLLVKELSEPFQGEQAPVRALLFFLSPENKLFLALTFNHVFTDARGALTVFSFLLNDIYSSKANTPAYKISPTPSQESLLPGSVKGFSLLRHLIHTGRRNINNNSCSAQNQIYPAPQREFSLFRETFNSERTGCIVKYCKAGKISLTSLLAAIQCSLVRDLIPSREETRVVINIPFDNRKSVLNEENEGMPGLYITIPQIDLPVKADYNIGDLARIIDSKLQSLRSSNERFLTFQLFPARLFPPGKRGVRLLSKSLGKKPVSSMLTNLGRVNLESDKNEVLPVPYLDFLVAPSRDCIICTSAVTYKNCLSLSLAINTAITGIERSLDIRERYISRLLLSVYS